jgi:asparaginyl-tRNA synthetase
MTSSIDNILRTGQVGEQITVRGWIRSKRESKGFAFVDVSDGSCMANIQVVIAQSLADYGTLIKRINTGASVEVVGQLVESPAKGQRVELQASGIEVFGEADPETYPLQKKRHSFEFLREIGHLRGRTNTMGAVFRVRNACATAIHQFFQEKGFLWVHTPIISASDCEGAGEMFNITTLNPDKLPRTPEGKVDYSQDFFGRQAFLSVSGQLEAEIMAMAFSNVYTFGPTFRAENSNTSRHLAEFWMIEPEMAFCNLQGDMNLAEEFLRYVFRYVMDKCMADMEFFQQRIDDSVLATAENIINNEFARLTYTEAIDILEKADRSFEYPVSWGLDLQSEHERYLAEEVFKKPTFLYAPQ